MGLSLWPNARWGTPEYHLLHGHTPLKLGDSVSNGFGKYQLAQSPDPWNQLGQVLVVEQDQQNVLQFVHSPDDPGKDIHWVAYWIDNRARVWFIDFWQGLVQPDSNSSSVGSASRSWNMHEGVLNSTHVTWIQQGCQDKYQPFVVYFPKSHSAACFVHLNFPAKVSEQDHWP